MEGLVSGACVYAVHKVVTATLELEGQAAVGASRVSA